MYVFPNCRSVVLWEGSRVRINPDQRWRADDPFVLARPELFDTDPARVDGSRYEPPVERATDAPGERRSTPSRRKSTGGKKKVDPLPPDPNEPTGDGPDDSEQ